MCQNDNMLNTEKHTLRKEKYIDQGHIEFITNLSTFANFNLRINNVSFFNSLRPGIIYHRFLHGRSEFQHIAVIVNAFSTFYILENPIHK